MKTILLSTFLLLFIFDLNAKIIYVEPVRNAKYVNINNNIIIGFDIMIDSFNLNDLLKVTGTISGIHTGEILLTPDKRKLIFKPEHPFAFNELIEVKLNHLKTSFNTINNLTYTFQTQVSKPHWENRSNDLDESEYSPGNNYVYSDNNATLPELTVNISNNPSPGHIFLTNYSNTNYTPHLIIANNDGTPYYSRETPTNVADFSRQPNGLLTYYSFLPGNLNGKYYAEDTQYNIVDSFYCGNGYSTDTHDLRVLNNGHALLISYDPQIVDMSLIVPGGNPNATVLGLIIQEIDENKNVVFQWRSWDHFLITDAIHVDLTAALVDCVHGNAIELDNDGNLMLSSRHLSEITKINRTTGEIIWRMGGVHNEFTFVNDSIKFSYQHNIRRISNGNITLYDNGNFHSPSFSRAVEYHLDEINKIATLVWQYKNNPVIYGPSRGSVQRLLNGNTLICWGTIRPTMTEVTSTGIIALEMSLPVGTFSYRTIRDEVNITLNIKLAIEGFYNTKANMLNIKDTVTAYLRSNISPYSIVDSAKSVIDSINLIGNFRYYNVTTGNYYIALKHRNGIETWSKAGGESFISGEVYLYDFTNSSSNAYGNNLVLKGSKYCIYSGDVNQDENIDLNDLLLVSNDANNFIIGYVNTDVNGDRVIDLTDLLITSENSNGFVSVIKP